MRHVVAVAFSFLFLQCAVKAAFAQESSISGFEQTLRFQGFFFGGPAGINTTGGGLVELGGGFDYLAFGGFGLGVEASVLAGAGGAIGTGGVNASYHFLPSSPGIEPYVVGGMSFGGAAEFGNDGYTWAAAGAGFNYWFNEKMAFRLEVKGRWDVEDDSHTVSLRLGMTF